VQILLIPLKTKQFGDKFQNRLFNVGIAEANLVSLAAGLAIAGKTVFASTLCSFSSGRGLDQIRNAICYPYLNVKLVVSHAGLTVGPDGSIAPQTDRGHFYDENNPNNESSLCLQMQISREKFCAA
jgi:transketolase